MKKAQINKGIFPISNLLPLKTIIVDIKLTLPIIDDALARCTAKIM